jgi:hypothetical protein
MVLISAQDWCTVCAESTTGIENHFRHTRWNSYVTWVKWKLVLVCLEIVLISVQDRCTVYAECTMGMEVILGTPNGTPR